MGMNRALCVYLTTSIQSTFCEFCLQVLRQAGSLQPMDCYFTAIIEPMISLNCCLYFYTRVGLKHLSWMQLVFVRRDFGVFQEYRDFSSMFSGKIGNFFLMFSYPHPLGNRNFLPKFLIFFFRHCDALVENCLFNS